MRRSRIRALLTPTFRFVALPLAAVVVLAALSMQPAASKASRDPAVPEQVVDCSALRTGDVCVIGHAGWPD